MPIIIDDHGNSRFVGDRNMMAGCEPTDYSPLLTGGYEKKGVMNTRLLAYGSKKIPENYSKFLKFYSEGSDGVYYPFSAGEKYTVLVKDTSIFCNLSDDHIRRGSGSKADGENRGGLPSSIFEDVFLTYEKSGRKITVYSKLILDRILVYFGKENYVLGEYKLLLAEKSSADPDIVTHESIRVIKKNYDITRVHYSTSDNPIAFLYSEIYTEYENMLAKSGINEKSIRCCIDPLIERDCAKPMYDMLVGELEMMRNPKIISGILRYFAGLSFELVRRAIRLIGETNAPVMLFRKVIDNFIKGYKAETRFLLKMENTPLLFASELGEYIGKDSQPEELQILLGKKYDSGDLSLSPEQEEAIESYDRITVVEGGPGTGKTTVIKHRLRFMSQNGADMKKICVLTATKEAAAAIKSEYKECQVYSKNAYAGNLMAKILKEASLGTVSIKNEKAYEKYIAGCGQNEVRFINRLFLYQNFESLKPESEHIIIDDAQEYLSIELLCYVKLALKFGMSLFITGYSRKTDIDSMYRVRPELDTPMKVLGELFHVHKLSVNFRSDQAVLDMFNCVFGTGDGSDCLQGSITGKFEKNVLEKNISVLDYNPDIFEQRGLKETVEFVNEALRRGETTGILVSDGSQLTLFNRLSAALPDQSIVHAVSAPNGKPEYLYEISKRLDGCLYHSRSINGFKELADIIKLEACKLNYERFSQKMNAVDASVSGWLDRERENSMCIIRNLKDPKRHDQEINRLRYSMLLFGEELMENGFMMLLSKKSAERPSITLNLMDKALGSEFDNAVIFVTGEKKVLSEATLAGTACREEYIGFSRARKRELIICDRTVFGENLIRKYKKLLE